MCLHTLRAEEGDVEQRAMEDLQREEKITEKDLTTKHVKLEQ